VIFLFFLTPNINTGDAGDLISASHYLGTAHPSGYPLYLLIAKTFTFLPMGNMAFKVALVSAVFSSLALVIVYWLVFRLTLSDIAAIFTVAILMASYSYFTQSVVAKFYPLNLFLILAVFAIWLFRLETKNSNVPVSKFGHLNSEQSLYLTAFMLGLIAANHHTGILIFIVVFAALFLGNFKDVPNKKTLATWFSFGLILFLLGFIINAYILIRGFSSDFFNATKVQTIRDFYAVITREAYKGGGTVTIATYTLHGALAFWHGLKNFVSILTMNFSIFSHLLFLLGCFYMLRKNYKIFIILIVSLLFYGPFIARLALGITISEEEYYVAAHQYLIPAFAFFAVMAGLGFYQFAVWLNKLPLKLIPKILPAIIAFFPLIFLISRAADSNYRTNNVPYQLTKDMYSILPVNSVFLTFGDNATYQGWYMKIVGRYREDICQLASASTRDKTWRFEGCNKEVYGNVLPAFFSQDINKMIPVMMQNRFYAIDVIVEGSPYDEYLSSRFFSLVNLYLPNEELAYNNRYNLNSIDSFLYERIMISDKIINPQVCLSHFTDDFFTRRICARYAIHLTDIAKRFSDERYGVTGKKVNIRVGDDVNGNSTLLYTVDVTTRNEPYLALATLIQEYNQWKIFYLREK
jgi:hypothetical protein